MAYRTLINYTAAQTAEMWDRWQRGESLPDRHRDGSGLSRDAVPGPDCEPAEGDNP
jgi:hypothetical protein